MANKIDFEFVLNNELGQFGRYQLINLFLATIPALVSGFMAAEYIFTASKLTLRCAVPECDLSPADFAPSWILSAIPMSNTGELEECARYLPLNNTDIYLNNTEDQCSVTFDVSSTIPCESYVYERTNSVVYDFGLECKEWLRTLAGTLNSLGGMFALPLAGFVSDHFGRRTSIVVFSFNLALTGVIRSFSVNYIMYVIFQFLQTALGGGTFSAAYILATELVGPKYRVRTSALMSSMFALGEIILGLSAYAIVEWRTLSRVLFAPVFLLLSYHRILNESHRWLISKNREGEARAVLKKACSINGRTISDDSLDFLVNTIPKVEKDDKHEPSLLSRVLKSTVMLRRCCTTPIWWVTTTFVYYGLSINAVSLSGNMYFNYVATVAVEIPGFWTAVLLLDRIGRKTTVFWAYLSCAACCIAFAFIPTIYTTLSLCIYLLGKFSISIVFTSVYLYTSELYPTRHRHTFLGFSSMVGRVGSIVSPLTPPLMIYWRGIPSVLFGFMALLSASLVLSQPETKGAKLPDTFEDAEQIGIKKPKHQINLEII